MKRLSNILESSMKHEKVYLVTDGCMWEANSRNGTFHAHAIEVVDLETGAVQYIRSGSRIAFIEGEITDIRTQEAYNEKAKALRLRGKDNVSRDRRKEGDGASSVENGK